MSEERDSPATRAPPLPISPRHSREGGNPDGFSQDCRPKPSVNRGRQIPSPYFSPPSFPRKRESRRFQPRQPPETRLLRAANLFFLDGLAGAGISSESGFSAL